MNLFSKTFLGAGVAALTAALALSAQAALNLGNLPLWFEAGHGQEDGSPRFIAHGQDAEFSITSTGAEFMLHQADGHQATVHMTFVGASAESRLAGDKALGGKINYLLGNDPAQWQPGVPTYGQVRLDQVYPGVNVVYYGNQQKLEYDFDLAAGVNPQAIAIRFDGAEKLSINPQGELVIQLDGGKIVQQMPVAYQVISGAQRAVKVGYKIVDAHTAAFAVGNFDPAQPLVIDPVLGYSTFFGGNYGDTAWAIAVNPVDNSIFVAGQTLSTLVSNSTPTKPLLHFATTNNAFQTTNAGGIAAGDAFVAKLVNSGTNVELAYCTYLGGKVDDAAYALAVDGAGHAFIAGATDSTNFPVVNPVVYGKFNGGVVSGKKDVNIGYYPEDAFVSELSADGSSLVYSTYLGGESSDAALGLAVDPAGDAFVTGVTFSTNFPVTPTALINHLICSNNFYVNANAFVSEIAAGGNQLVYSTYLGGTNFDYGRAIAYNNGNVFVAGYTASTNFPWSKGLVACTNLNGFTNATAGSDAFVTMFAATNISGTNLLALQYSTFLGSSNNDTATGIAADSSGNAYVVGWTTSTNFPVTTNGIQLSSYVRTNSTGFVYATNAFLAQITWNGTNAALGYSQVFGGLGVDMANSVALDGAGNVFIVGSTSSTNFPVTGSNLLGALHSTNSSTYNGLPYQSDVFVTAFASGFNNLLYSAYLGGSGNDYGYGIAMDSDGNAYITGQTLSTNFPVLGSWSTNSAALHPYMDGTNDAFVTKILTAFAPPALNIKKTGTNVLVYWQSFSDVTPATLGLETTTNLFGFWTNIFYITNFTYVTNHSVITTNRSYVTNRFVISGVPTNNWKVVANPVPVLTNTIAPTNIFNYIYIFNPTNEYRFYRFHKF